jgi:hypothetical protein
MPKPCCCEHDAGAAMGFPPRLCLRHHDGRGCKCRGVALAWPRGWILDITDKKRHDLSQHGMHNVAGCSRAPPPTSKAGSRRQHGRGTPAHLPCAFRFGSSELKRGRGGGELSLDVYSTAARQKRIPNMCARRNPVFGRERRQKVSKGADCTEQKKQQLHTHPQEN